jgi:predicted nuclease of predicted toxin-antitoxin system
MRLLVDANLSPRVSEALSTAGFEATHVVDHGLLAASDEVIAAFAVSRHEVIVSADSDLP